ncbi:MAG: helix-turn-helix transcriptional regulator [Halopseudomonas sp.]|uniref:helix-turn-helix transcriptional regulator n=1 Tax=Halopseudomonas sp. TaxID=2901191 RepID=UPI0030017098
MNLIAEVRKKHDIKQAELVRELGWKQSRLGNYENHSRVPGLAESRAIVSALNRLGAGCTLDDVFPPSDDYQHSQAA